MPLCGRADLVRLLATDKSDKERFLAGLVGYYLEEEPGAKERMPGLTTEIDQETNEADDRFEPRPSEIDWAPLPFFFGDHFQPYPAKPEGRKPERDVTAYGVREIVDRHPPGERKMPPTPPLASWSRLRRRVANLLLEPYQSRHLDVDLLLRDLCKGRMPRTLPFRRRQRWPRQLKIIIDRSYRLTPFQQDQHRVTGRLKRRLGKHNVHEFRADDFMAVPLAMGRARRRKLELFANDHIPVLVLGDCGSLSGYGPLIKYWLELARLLHLKGSRMSVLTPAPPGRRFRELPGWLQIAGWEDARTVQGHSKTLFSARADRLLGLVSHAIRVEPGLLRTVRRLMPPGDADAGTESDVWCHPEIAGGSSIALTISRDNLKNLEERFQKEDPQLRERVLAAIKEWHSSLPKEIWYEELLNLSEDDQKRFPEAERKKARQDFRRIAQTILLPPQGMNRQYVAALHEWFGRFENRTGLNKELWAGTQPLSRMLQKAATVVHERDVVSRTPVGYDPRKDGKPGAERLWAVRQTGGRLLVTEEKHPKETTANGSMVAVLRSTRPVLHCIKAAEADVLPGEDESLSVFLDPDTGAVIRQRLTKPSWASAMGKDEYGIWVSFRYRSVEQRLRWIPPGRFMMGSPENETGRYDDERQHPVTLTQGFWLFDTPVTQALWEAVLDDNPSRFKGPDRPVESVSWDDCIKFIEKLNGEIRDLKLQLPGEAQWEYACRAGTITATYGGDLEDETTASVLQDIAWYSGNSNSQTHPVGEKKPNPWGLHDMLGNVWEWCRDWWQIDLGSKPVVDPTGPERGPGRVVRGGSWFFDARYVRAGFRNRFDPGYRHGVQGFRCARVQERPGAESGGPGGAGSRIDVPAGAVFSASRGVKYIVKPAVSIPLSPGEKMQLQSDQGRLNITTLSKPAWAAAMGRDRFGLWMDFQYETATQRLRWMPPGQFMMGSPKGEAGRFDWERQYPVTLTQGFWLFDTPVTQTLWEAVMGDNPSRFKSPDRPVENVSWNDCRKFIEKLNGEIPDLMLQLPGEAQWEYSCRAGTTTATYAGDLEIRGERNAPLLDEIAWYGGNSGIDFELENGHDSSGWPEKQYDHKWAGTHPVGKKQPNPWGLYDMLGNVWEWCADYWQEDLGSKPVVDPTGPEKGSRRVVRGGSWINDARSVRAAFRGHDDPGFRSGFRGFRCARVQEG